jgi:hypothetical protein
MNETAWVGWEKERWKNEFTAGLFFMVLHIIS